MEAPLEKQGSMRVYNSHLMDSLLKDEDEDARPRHRWASVARRFTANLGSLKIQLLFARHVGHQELRLVRRRGRQCDQGSFVNPS